MGASVTADVNPALVSWAREQSGLDAAAVARRIGVREDRLLAWERGEARPTVRQAIELARRYGRPFGLFFLPQPPAVSPLASEYRRLPGIAPGGESPEFRLAIRTMLYRREATIELADELGTPLPRFGGTATLGEDPSAVGRRLRALLGISLDEQFAWKDDWQAWRRWRRAVEAAGVPVYQFPKVALEQVRGVALLAFPLPAVGINSKEQSPGARAFTLMHELAHLALARGREERAALHEARSDAEWFGVEQFAEKVASDVLVPDAALRQVLLEQGAVGQWNLQRVRVIASRFRVTPLAMATRLRTAGVLAPRAYREWRAQWEAYVATLKPRAGGPTSPVDRALSRAGRPLAELVVDALDANRISSVDASRYLDLRFDHFHALREELRHGHHSGSRADDGDE